MYATALQTDGKILVGGTFTNLARQPRNSLGRLNGDGTLDTSFNPGASGMVQSLVVQSGGKILVGGSFTNLAGLPRNNLGRLNSNGTLDTSFSAEVDGGVGCLALQPDGKILVAGGFTTLAGQTRTNIGRLNGDGSLDTTCSPAADRTVYSLALQPDGKIVAGGDFTTLCGQSRSHLGRLNRDGTLDASFNPSVGSVSGRVRCLAVQADESILVGCSLPLGFLGWNNLTRLHSNGTLDTTFNPRVTNYVYCLAMQTDGKILVGTGSPTYRDPLGPRYYYPLARLNSNGSVDAAFKPEVSGFWGVNLPPLSSGLPFIPWRCRRMERLWWEAISRCWLGSRALALAGLTAPTRPRNRLPATGPTSPGCAAALAPKSGRLALTFLRMGRTGSASAPAPASPEAGNSPAFACQPTPLSAPAAP